MFCFVFEMFEKFVPLPSEVNLKQIVNLRQIGVIMMSLMHNDMFFFLNLHAILYTLKISLVYILLIHFCHSNTNFCHCASVTSHLFELQVHFGRKCQSLKDFTSMGGIGCNFHQNA